MKKLALVAGSLVVGLLFSEGVIRVFKLAPEVMTLEIASANFDSKEGVYQLSENPKLFYEPKPETGSFNSLGYLSREAPGGDLNAFHNIVILGDSQTYGVRVDFKNTFAFLIEERLNSENPPKPVRVHNLAVPGYGLLQEFERFKTLGLKLHPKTVLFFLCNNDLHHASMEMTSFDILAAADKNNFLTSEAQTQRLKGLHKLALNSAIYRKIFFFKRAPAASNNRISQNDPENVSDEQLKATLHELAELSRQYDFRATVILLPASGDIYWGGDRQRVTSLKDVGTWDLHAYFHERVPASETDVNFMDPSHFHPPGHNRVADMLMQERDRWL